MPSWEAEIQELAKKRDELIERIQAAWEGVTIEDGTTIDEAFYIDFETFSGDPDFEANCDRIRSQSQTSSWRDIDIFQEDPTGGAISFFDALGFRYHLPCYLVMDLFHLLPTDPCRIDGAGLGGQLLSEFEPGAPRSPFNDRDRPASFWATVGYEYVYDRYRLERFNLLTPDQRRCVAEYLLLILEISGRTDHDSAARAIYVMWSTDLSTEGNAHARELIERGPHPSPWTHDLPEQNS